MLVVGGACSFTRWRNSGFFGCGFQGLNPVHADRTIVRCVCRCSYVMTREACFWEFSCYAEWRGCWELSNGPFFVVASFFGRSGRVGSLNFRMCPIRAMSPIFHRLTHCSSRKGIFRPERRTCSRTLTALWLLLLGYCIVPHRSFFVCFTRSCFALISQGHRLGLLFLPIL
jgi:hypothetical protein